MSKSILLLFALQFGLITLSLTAQTNIIKNGSFVGTPTDPNACIEIIPQGDIKHSDSKAMWKEVPDWDMPDRYGLRNFIPTPDRLCDNSGQFPAYGRTVCNDNVDGYREYITGFLDHTLNSGKSYYFEFYVKILSGSIISHNQFGLKLSKSKPIQRKRASSKYELILDGQGIYIPGSVKINDTWQKITGKFTANDEFSWVTIGGFGESSNTIVGDPNWVWTNIQLYDIGYPEEPCPPIKYVQDTKHYGDYLEAENKLRSGFAVGAPFPATTGNVNINDWAHVVYKAGEEVNLEPGFSTGDGSNFLAYIAPCEESPCPEIPDVDNKEFEFCDDDSHEILCDFSPGFMQSVKWQPNDFLSADNVTNPTFTPTTNSGVKIYQVTITDACGVSKTQQVVVSWTTTGTPPVLSLTNVINEEYEHSFDIITQAESEWLELEIIRKSDGVVVHQSGRVYADDVYLAGVPFRLETPINATSICHDYEVKVRTKHRCNPDVIEETLDWDRSGFCNPKPFVGPLPNVFTPNGDGINDEFCVNVCGAEEFEIEVVSVAWGLTIFTNSGNVTSNFLCLWDGSVNGPLSVNGEMAPAGFYTYTFTIKGCGGEITEVVQPVTIIN